jgi:WD40 repeat protein
MDLIKLNKVEIVARQLSDFETYFVKFNSIVANSIICCGKENIKLFKIKSGHLPGQSVILNNTARGKTFNKAVIQYTDPKKPSYLFVTTFDGLLYFVNYNTRQVDKIIQIHEDSIVSLIPSKNNDFFLTASSNGVLRIWSTDFECLKSEVNTGN